MSAGAALPEADRMSKPRVVVPVSVQFSVRYLLRTGLIGRLAEFADVVALIEWDDPELSREFGDAGVEVRRLPAPRFGARYERVRSDLKAWHSGRLRSPSTAIDLRRTGATTRRSSHHSKRSNRHSNCRSTRRPRCRRGSTRSALRRSWS